MKNNNKFSYNYSANEQTEIKKLREKYTLDENRQMSKLDMVRKLDTSVQKKAISAALTLGIIGLLLLGTGMSLVMTDFSNILGAFSQYSIIIGIVIGITGIILTIITYPVYNLIIKKERKRIAPEILRLTDELLNE